MLTSMLRKLAKRGAVAGGQENQNFGSEMPSPQQPSNCGAAQKGSARQAEAHDHSDTGTAIQEWPKKTIFVPPGKCAR